MNGERNKRKRECKEGGVRYGKEGSGEMWGKEGWREREKGNVGEREGERKCVSNMKGIRSFLCHAP